MGAGVTILLGELAYKHLLWSCLVFLRNLLTFLRFEMEPLDPF